MMVEWDVMKSWLYNCNLVLNNQQSQVNHTSV